MEKDIENLLNILKDKNQSVEEFLNFKLPLSLRLHLQIRNFTISLLKLLIYLILIIIILLLLIVLSIFIIEFFHIYPLHKSFAFVDTVIINILTKLVSDDNNDSRKCLIENRYKELLRKPTKCDFCYNIDQIKRVSNISRDDFLKQYAYSGRPVIVTDATNRWTAKKLFSFEFFQTVYAYSIFTEQNKLSEDHSIFNRRSLSIDEKISILNNSDRDWKWNCQFFNYQTKYESLEEFLATNMTDSRRTDPWYVGWSNCDPFVSKLIRQHYSIPYFLPEFSEMYNSDWIFMGYPGYGARMHIDFVIRPSWQAQLKGRKLWKLKPPHECRLTCPREIKAIVETGDIIVLDTNLWYHQTEIIGDEISVTIGAEYD